MSMNDNAIHKLEMGENNELVGFVRSENYEEARKTIIYFGGTGEIAYNAVASTGRSFDDYVFVSVDFPGSQESEGKINLESIQYAATAAYDAVSTLDYVDKENIFVLGFSYGTGIATYLASERDCAKLVLISPYRDFVDLYNLVFPIFNSPFAWFITDNIDTKSYAENVEESTLIITSDSDGVLDSSKAKSLAENFETVRVKEFTGIKHQLYFTYEEVPEEVIGFCQ